MKKNSRRRWVVMLMTLFVALLACKGTSGPEDVKAADGTCTLSKPAGWIVATSLHDEASLQVQEPLQDAYLVVLVDVKSDLALANLQAFSDLVRGNMQKASSQFNETDRRDLQIGGRPAISYRIDATVENVNITYLHTVIEGEKHYLQVLGWTSRSKYADKRATLESITSSIREL